MHDHNYMLAEFIYRTFWVCRDCGHEPTKAEFYEWAELQNA